MVGAHIVPAKPVMCVTLLPVSPYGVTIAMAGRRCAWGGAKLDSYCSFFHWSRAGRNAGRAAQDAYISAESFCVPLAVCC